MYVDHLLFSSVAFWLGLTLDDSRMMMGRGEVKPLRYHYYDNTHILYVRYHHDMAVHAPDLNRLASRFTLCLS